MRLRVRLLWLRSERIETLRHAWDLGLTSLHNWSAWRRSSTSGVGSTNVARSYAQCLAARVFQELGWGAFDTLVVGSIPRHMLCMCHPPKCHSSPDPLTGQEHERGIRIAIYSIVAATTTQGPPFLGQFCSQPQTGLPAQPALHDPRGLPVNVFGSSLESVGRNLEGDFAVGTT